MGTLRVRISRSTTGKPRESLNGCRISQLISFASRLTLSSAAGSEATAAARDATKEIPIVMTNGGDIVRLGFVASLARPGGNLTGLISNPSELAGKRLELVKEAVPKAKRMAILQNPETRVDAANVELQSTARALGLQLQIHFAPPLENARTL